MITINTRRTFFSPVKASLCVLALLLAFFSMPISAFADKTSKELEAEHEAIVEELGFLQDELNDAEDAYDLALEANRVATEAMEAAQERIDEAEARIDDLQERLGDRMSTMYKNGNITFFDVLLESKTFDEFLSSLDMLNRINIQDADLVQETKEAREEAQEARDEYENQKQIAQDEMDKAEALAIEIENKQDELREESKRLTEEIAVVKAKEELEAEEARKAAEAAAAAEAQIKAQQAAAASSGGNSGGGSSNNQGVVDSGGGSSSVVGSGGFYHPCPSGSYSSMFGYREFDKSFHQGVDLAASEGTPYYAAATGTVIAATYDGGYNGGAGNWVVIVHGNGLVTKYMHSSSVMVSVGQQVSAGDQLGTVGNTGNSFGAHLHFQVELNGAAVDPMLYL